MHGLLTREVKTDEGQDLLCDFRPVRKVLPEEVGKQLLLQLAATRLARFMVCCYLFTTWALQIDMARVTELTSSFVYAI
jgi:hypothetical protein